MSKIFLIATSLILSLSSTSLAQHTVSYVFPSWPRQLVIERTMAILESYQFPILSMDSGQGHIETDFRLIDQKSRIADFQVKYIIEIADHQYGTQMVVTSTVIEDPSNKFWTKRDEIKSARWMIKMVMGIIDR